jgi:GNAT superfamily N-acetyltransferase
MGIKLELANPDDADEVAALRCATAAKLTQQFGKGVWSGNVSNRGVLLEMRRGKVFVARLASSIIATLTLSTRKPWAIDTKYFSPVEQALYLTSMAIVPDRQRTGLGSACVAAAATIANKWPADAIRLDAYDSPAGAGPFYKRCGFCEVGRATYRDTPLIYFERLL